MGCVSKMVETLKSSEDEPKSVQENSSTKGNLSQHHQSVHEGTKYSCGSCDYQSSHRANVSKHKKSVHDKVRYPCSSCDFKASLRRNLRRHQKAAHEEGEQYPCTL